MEPHTRTVPPSSERKINVEEKGNAIALQTDEYKIRAEVEYLVDKRVPLKKK